jgi:hypothetical protein
MRYPKLHERIREGKAMRGRIALVISLVTFFDPSMFARQRPSQVILKANAAEGGLKEFRAEPASTVKTLFPTGEAILEMSTLQPSWPPKEVTSGRKVQFVTVHDAREQVIATAAIYGDRVFVFESLFCGQNAVGMNDFLKAAQIVPRAREDALGLARLYLTLTSDSLEPPARIVVSDVADLPRYFEAYLGGGYDEDVAYLRTIVHVPKVTQHGSLFEVDLFAADLLEARGGFELHEWNFTIDAGGLRSIRDRTVELNEGWREEQQTLYAEARAHSASHEQDQIKFLESFGFVGGRDGIKSVGRSWVASDGPRVWRVVFHLDSPANANAELRKRIGAATRMIETVPWFQSKRKEGRRTGLVESRPSIGPARHILKATIVWTEGPDLIEMSSVCLRNLIAANGQNLGE